MRAFRLIPAGRCFAKLLRLTLVLTGIAWMTACAPVSSPASAGTSASPAAAGATAAAVQMTDALKFDPASVTVPRGTTVTWRNTSQTAHTVTDDPAKAANPADAQLPSGAQAWDSGMWTRARPFRIHSIPRARTNTSAPPTKRRACWQRSSSRPERVRGGQDATCVPSGVRAADASLPGYWVNMADDYAERSGTRRVSRVSRVPCSANTAGRIARRLRKAGNIDGKHDADKRCRMRSRRSRLSYGPNFGEQTLWARASYSGSCSNGVANTTVTIQPSCHLRGRGAPPHREPVSGWQTLATTRGQAFVNVMRRSPVGRLRLERSA
jgi:plastocyanin